MAWPLDNLGEYNDGRDAIKACGGSFKAFKALFGTKVGACVLLAASPILLVGGAIAGIKGKKILDENPEKVIKTLENINNKIQEM